MAITEILDEPKVLAGGLAVETLQNGTAEDVLFEARNAMAQTARKGFILTPSCTINARSPEANLRAARRAVEEMASR